MKCWLQNVVLFHIVQITDKMGWTEIVVWDCNSIELHVTFGSNLLVPSGYTNYHIMRFLPVLSL